MFPLPAISVETRLIIFEETWFRCCAVRSVSMLTCVRCCPDPACMELECFIDVDLNAETKLEEEIVKNNKESAGFQ